MMLCAAGCWVMVGAMHDGTAVKATGVVVRSPQSLVACRVNVAAEKRGPTVTVSVVAFTIGEPFCIHCSEIGSDPLTIAERVIESPATNWPPVGGMTTSGTSHRATRMVIELLTAEAPQSLVAFTQYEVV